MAGGTGARSLAAWVAVSRTVVLLAIALGSLLVVAAVAVFTVDAAEATSPRLKVQDYCDRSHPNIFLSEAGGDTAACRWRGVMLQNFARKALLQVDETASGTFQATATITTVPGDPLVTMVQHGDGRDADTFFSTTIGFISAGKNAFIWSPPTVTTSADDASAVISITGSVPDQPPLPSAVQLDVSAFSLPGRLEVSTKQRTITGLSADGKVISESAHALVVDNHAGEELLVSVEPTSAQNYASPPGPVGAHWVAKAASTAWGLLSGFAGMLIPAGAWIALFIASRTGAFGVLGRRPAWRRIERALGAAVLAHVTVSACFQMMITEETLRDSLFTSSRQNRLARGMVEEGLWSPNGYPIVPGGLILLVAFALASVGWDPRERKRSSARGRYGIAAGAVALGVAAVSAYVALAHGNPAFHSREMISSGGTVTALGYSLPPSEFPLVIMAFLLVVFLVAVWISGGRAAALATFGDSQNPAAVRIAKAKGVIGGGALGLAAVLIGVGFLAAIAYLGKPMSVEPETLWATASAASLIMIAVLGASALALLTPSGGPQQLTPARRRFSFAVLLSMPVLALVLPFGLIPHLVDAAATDTDPQLMGLRMLEVSGSDMLAACAAVAVSLMVAAAAASRGRRATRVLSRMYWLIPLVMALTVAAPITMAGGYIPVGLRWGIVIIAGTCLGTAVGRLTVTVISPLRPSADRPRYSWAILLVAMVVAIPWGDLGHGVQIGWWSLLTYATRIDEVLPLILVAGGVVALRRFGLLPGRDEATLTAHRKVAVAAWIVVFSDSYSLGGTADLASMAALATAAIAAWLLMPKAQVRHAGVILGQSEQEVATAVRRAMDTGIARRILPSMAKSMRDEVAAGKITFTDAQEKIARLEELTSTKLHATARGHMGSVTDSELAFGGFISPRPWERARWGMTYGAVSGAPWILLGLAGASVPLDAPEGYPELALIAAVAPLVLRWIGYGLLFSYFFPLLRGKSGLGKSISFFAASVAPSILSTLASPHPVGEQWHSAGLLAVQSLIFALTMGLLADLAVLRKHGFTAGRLVDLHSLWTVSAWASSVVVAVATGVATIVLAGLQPFVIGVITPSQPSAPPASASHP